MIRKHVVLAVFKRNFVGYLSSPAGYVFITLFILLSAGAAFWHERFFANNLANLDSLNQLFPYLLLFFIPAITMGLWAEERKQGTEELLLTLPARDSELILGKYFAALGIYTVSLVFSGMHVFVLYYLGKPDLGVMLGTYIGYWFLGAALIAVGSVASLLTSSMTVAFILGAVFCAVPVFMSEAGAVLPREWESGIESLGVTRPFRDMTSGVFSLRAFAYFACLTALMLYLNLALLSRRHARRSGYWVHPTLRSVALFVAAISLGVLTGRAGARVDLTQEGLHSLTQETRDVLAKIDPERPVYIQAFVSAEVPRSYVETRENLLALLREYDAMGGDRVQLRVTDTTLYSEEAREAEEKYGIKAERVFARDSGRREPEDIFLGVAFTCGAEEVVVPFLHRGLSVEYELTRSIGVVSGQKRRKVGVVNTDAKLFGGFDFQTFQSQRSWPIVDELKKQYEVAQVNLDQEISDRYDALIVAMPSSLTQPQMDNLLKHVKKGGPALLFDDPLPLINPGLAPSQPKRAPGRNNMFGGQPPSEPKGDIRKFMDAIGISWPTDRVVWDAYNPHPDLQHLPQEFIFVGPGSGNRNAFQPSDPISSGLQEMVLLCPGYLLPRGDMALQFTPLLTSTRRGGTLFESEILRRDFLMTGWNPDRLHRPGGVELVLAARVQGTLPPAPATAGSNEPPPAPASIHVVMVADLDLVSEQFFAMRAEGAEGLNFDNVTFVLNAVDVLAGDMAYVSLRKRRPRHRTLEKFEDRTKEFKDRQIEETKNEEEEAKKQLAEAQARFDKKVQEVRENKEMDDRSKEEQIRYLQQVENQRLEARKKEIEDRKKSNIEKGRVDMEGQIAKIQKQIRWFAVLMPPIPAILVGIWVWAVRTSREAKLGDKRSAA